MIVFLINTFNDTYYNKKADDLLSNIRSQLNTYLDIPYVIVVVKGGCGVNNSAQVNNIVYIEIQENLSDHNIYTGFKRNVNTYFASTEYKNATYVVLHDTCMISPQFHNCVKSLLDVKLNDGPQWIFAHTYGLYNIGVCNYRFMLKRGCDFDGIFTLPKNEGIQLEQGTNIKIQDKMIPSLLSYSKYTLAKIINHDSLEKGVHNVDSYAINGINDDGKVRWMVYIASLGVYKLYGSVMSFFIPVWCSDNHQPKDESHYNTMTQFGKQNATTFIPLIGYTKKK